MSLRWFVLRHLLAWCGLAMFMIFVGVANQGRIDESYTAHGEVSGWPTKCDICLARARASPHVYYEFGLCSIILQNLTALDAATRQRLQPLSEHGGLPSNVLVEGDWYDVWSPNLTASQDASSFATWVLAFYVLYFVEVLWMASAKPRQSPKDASIQTAAGSQPTASATVGGSARPASQAPKGQWSIRFLDNLVVGVDFLVIFALEIILQRYQLVPEHGRVPSSGVLQACWVSAWGNMWLVLHTVLYAMALLTTTLGSGLLACGPCVRSTVLIAKWAVALAFATMSCALSLLVATSPKHSHHLLPTLDSVTPLLLSLLVCAGGVDVLLHYQQYHRLQSAESQSLRAASSAQPSYKAVDVAGEPVV